jgi:alpha-amylase/alpha-mannosidase (GH57 family)
MLKIGCLFLLLVFVVNGYAHNPQVSTISMIQNENNKWSVFITAPLYTFQLVIKEKYPEMNMDSISPFEMQKLILDLVKRNFIINGDDAIKLTNDKVQLAHETTIFFDITNEDFLPIAISFTAFNKLYNHFTLLKIVSKKEKEITYILNTENAFEYPKKNEAYSRPIYLYLAICLVGILLFLFIKNFYRKLNLKNG